jgi:serine/threonine protein kinase
MPCFWRSLMNGQDQAPGNNDAGQSAPLRKAASPAKAVEPSPINPPTVSDYELIRRIGHGAYGDVGLARSNATGALRAAKIVWRHTFENERPFKREFEGIQRFERISREHPSQLALFHIGRNDAEGYFFYVMELADQAERAGEDGGLTMENGGKSESTTHPPRSSIFDPLLYTPHTLRADLEKGRSPAAKVLEIGLALTEALSHLHSRGLVHRDVKPSNVIFVNGRPKLADIGLVTDATDQCSIVGTEGYLPPEGPGTPQADIFALGKVLYEAATGLDRREFPKLPENLRTWPDAAQIFELNEIILKACATSTSERYLSVEALHEDLTLLKASKSLLRLQHLERVRRQWIKGGASAGVATVIGVSLLLLPIGGGLTRLSFDVPFAIRPNPRAEGVALVLLDEKSDSEMAWQPSRGRPIHANLIDRLTTEGARAIVFNILFLVPSADTNADAQLARAIERSRRVILATDPESTPPWKPFSTGAAALGLPLVSRDIDGVARRFLSTSSSLSSRTNIAWLPWTVAQFVNRPHRNINPSDCEHLWLNYYGPPGTLPSINYSSALSPNETPPQFFKDKIVFVGAGPSSTMYNDSVGTPYSRIGKVLSPEVEIQATATLNLLQGTWLRRVSLPFEMGLVLLSAALAGFGLMRFRAAVATALALVSILGIAILAQYLFAHKFVWFAWLIPVLEIGAAWLCSVICNAPLEIRLRSALRKHFSAK